MPSIPVGVPICSGVTPRISVPERGPLLPCRQQEWSADRYLTSPATCEPWSDHRVQDIKLQDVFINIVEVKVGSLPVGRHIIGRILNRCKVIDIHVVREYDNSPGC